MRRLAFVLAAAACGCAALDRVVDDVPTGPPPSPRSSRAAAPKTDPVVTAELLKLVGQGGGLGSTAPPSSRALDALAEAGTPECLRLWSRYASLAELLGSAITTAGDPMVDDRVVEAARWGKPEPRAGALLALARRKRESDKAVFEEALVGTDPVLHFALAEALEVWDRPEGAPMLTRLAFGNEAAVVRVYAAWLLARGGDPAGRSELLRQLDAGDWLARAMSARYLGALGAGTDYNMLLDRLGREQGQDFVSTELAVSALRLFPASQSSPFPSSAAAPADSDLEPLVVTAPRLKIPPTALIDGRINALLMRLIEERAESFPSQPDFGVLAAAASPEAARLRTRYSRLGFILIEGLTGTTDLLLRERLVKVAREAKNARIRAAALVALASDGDAKDRPLLEDALQSKDTAVRLGAIEAFRLWSRRSKAGVDVPHVRSDDPLGLYLAGGSISGARWIDDPDWVVRALALRSGNFAPDRLISWLSLETNPYLRAELVIALLHPSRRR
ncbi:MAG: HEAT repeat domain-containing protein [Elusimicrobia bacterium]|nr:HEAT repeat domain-containing protein [Elusimicrobiota bacterium]